MILCDTNIIIEIFKGNERIIQKIQNFGLENIVISSITVMELYFGALNKKELNRIKRDLSALRIAHFDPVVSELAVGLIETYSKSHGLQIPDAIIAATALSSKMALLTLNIKDFKYINGLRIASH